MKIEIEVPSQVIADLMTTAIESGDPVTTASRGGWCAGVYWQHYDFPVADIPKNTTEPGMPWYADPKLYERPDFQIAVHEIEDEGAWNGQYAPGSPGLKVHLLSLHDIGMGLKRMADKYAMMMGAVLNEDGDAESADIFLQLTTLKEVVYG